MLDNWRTTSILAIGLIIVGRGLSRGTLPRWQTLSNDTLSKIGLNVLVVLRSGFFLLLAWTKVLVLLEPAEVHRVPFLVPDLLQELGWPLCNGALLILNQLLYRLLLIIEEDTGSAPNASD